MSAPARPAHHRVIVRIVLPAILALAAVAALAAGPIAPTWIARLAQLLGADPGDGKRLLAGFFATTALVALVVGGFARASGFVGAGGLLFSGLATIAGFRIEGAATIAAGAVAAVLGATLLGLIRALPRAEPRPADQAQGPSHAWRILATITLATTAFALAARAPARTWVPAARAAPDPGVSPAVDLAIDTWIGKPLAATGIYRHLPALVASIGEGPVLLVFYSPRCGVCHDLFREHLAGALAVPVIAIEVPPPPDQPLAESDQPEAIDCPACQRLALPATTTWLVTPPSVVKVESGVVTCVSIPPTPATRCLVAASVPPAPR